MDYIWLILLFLLGAAMLFKPELLWKIEHLFSVKNGEPTEMYITLMRIGGVFFLVAALVCAVYAILT